MSFINTTESNNLLSEAAYVTTGIYLSIVGVFGFLGNSFVLLVLARGRPNFVRIHSCLLTNVAISDLIVSCTAHPLTAISGFQKRWAFSNIMCVASGFVVFLSSLCAIISMCLMAVSRYILVCKPEYEQYLKGKNLKYIMASTWLVSLVWTGAPLLGWGGYGPESFQTSCTLNWWTQSHGDISYNVLCVILCYCLPVAIYIFCYYRVVRTTFTKLGDAAAVAPSAPEHGTQRRQTSGNAALDSINRLAKVRASRHMTLICVSMVASFMIVWTPYAIITLLNIISSVPISPEVQVLPTMFCKCSCVFNPIIYGVFCQRFREATCRLITRNNVIHPVEGNGAAPTGQQ